jgi:L-amino acid N-acyltransferase YncA
MTASWSIRAASIDDAPACAAIYAPYVTGTAITFEVEAPSPAEFAERIATATATHAWLVLEDSGRVAGYAYAHKFAERAAYRFACETSIYLEFGRPRSGAGRALYEALFARLAERGYRQAIAGMTLPNAASEGLHRALGFEPVGTYRRIGWKNGGWHDVAWMQKTILAEPGPPAEPR